MSASTLWIFFASYEQELRSKRCNTCFIHKSCPIGKRSRDLVISWANEYVASSYSEIFDSIGRANEKISVTFFSRLELRAGVWVHKGKRSLRNTISSTLAVSWGWGSIVLVLGAHSQVKVAARFLRGKIKWCVVIIISLPSSNWIVLHWVWSILFKISDDRFRTTKNLRRVHYVS